MSDTHPGMITSIFPIEDLTASEDELVAEAKKTMKPKCWKDPRIKRVHWSQAKHRIYERHLGEPVLSVSIPCALIGVTQPEPINL